ncbi:MAG: hypothetical protein KatS3mg028_1417 [Bacteroidia bacterium]|nr:MAG: hypothetical protein KatS3mg028_1417 [Bacteroidia bacterium]GIV34114.1 MAG: hypothetical protein KatS3mg031_1649 [Chitinophagales bacterium]
MQFVYIDESGTGEELIAVMAGVIADSYRMRLTKADWNNLLVELSQIAGKEIDEIHTRDFYSGNSPWRNLTGPQRADIITAIFKWLHDRKHQVVYTAVHKQQFYNDLNTNKRLKEIGTLWRFMAMHIALSLQKKFQGAARGKNRTINPKGSIVLIFDQEQREQHQFTNFLLSPPDWMDAYYDKKPYQEKMSQIIDVPHFVDSKHVGLIQLADFICFFLRKHIELQLNMVQPAYKDEIKRIEEWINLIFARSISKNNIFMKRGRCECANLFYEYAPTIIR